MDKIVSAHVERDASRSKTFRCASAQVRTAADGTFAADEEKENALADTNTEDSKRLDNHLGSTARWSFVADTDSVCTSGDSVRLTWRISDNACGCETVLDTTDTVSARSEDKERRCRTKLSKENNIFFLVVRRISAPCHLDLLHIWLIDVEIFRLKAEFLSGADQSATDHRPI